MYLVFSISSSSLYFNCFSTIWFFWKPAYCRADLHSTAELNCVVLHKKVICDTPTPSVTPKSPPNFPRQKNLNDYFLTQSSPPPFFWTPQGFLMVLVLLSASVKRVSVSRKLEFFLQSVVSICCMPLMEL